MTDDDVAATAAHFSVWSAIMGQAQKRRTLRRLTAKEEEYMRSTWSILDAYLTAKLAEDINDASSSNGTTSHGNTG